MTFLSTSGGKFTAGFLKLHFLALRNSLRWLTPKITNTFRTFWILIEIFHIFDECFPAALCKLHSKCPEEHLEGFLSLKTPRKTCQFRTFGKRFCALLPKILWPVFQVALYATIVTFWGKTSFLKKFFLFPEFSDIERNLSRFVAENTDRKRNLLWFDCVKGGTSNKDGSFKTSMKFAVFFRRRTKTNWLFPEKK